MKNILLLSLIALAIITSCTERKPTWSDEFDKTGTPDSSKWNYDLGDGCPGNCGWGNNEAEFYTNDPKNVRVENGNLVIEAHKDSLGGKAYTSTRTFFGSLV